MLSWLRSFGAPRVGDGVRVRGGPYAGRTGTVVRITQDGRYAVYIDECCQPQLSRAEVRRVRRGANIGEAMRDAKESDLEGELARASAEIRDATDTFNTV